MTQETFDRIAEGLREAIAFAHGKTEGAVVHHVHPPEQVDVSAIRRAEGLTQAAFASRYGFTVSAVRDWEQGRRRPERAARILLKIIEREPDAVRRVLSAA